MEERTKEKAVGCFLFGGLGMAAMGAALTFLLYPAAAGALIRRGDANLWAVRGLGPGLILLGLGVAITALLVGIREGRRLTSGKGQIYADPGARVVARFAVDERGEMVVDEWLFDELDHLKFFVKLEHADGRIREYQCSRSVMAMCGEGMRGVATFDGRWLGGFVPDLGRPTP